MDGWMEGVGRERAKARGLSVCEGRETERPSNTRTCILGVILRAGGRATPAPRTGTCRESSA
eukprot:6200650-Pleurochrysis_carterae.AAC.3